MKRFAILLVSSLFIACGCTTKVADKNIVKIIFDTDLGPDYDDVGALAFLHSMADSGKAEILATISSNRHELVAPSIEIINSYFNRPASLSVPRKRKVQISDLRSIGPIQLLQDIRTG